MVQLQSSWFPVIDRDSQTFVDICEATEEDFQGATQSIYRPEEHASYVELLVVPER